MIAPSQSSAKQKAQLDKALAIAVSEYYADPVGFAYYAWPWGVKGGPLEKYEKPDDWQLRVMENVGKEVAKRGFDGFNPVMPIRTAISSGHGIGKGLYNGCMIHTPKGLIRWGDLKPGDSVFAPDGTSTEILAVYPQGERDIYRVTFDDGSSTEVDGEHNWCVKGRNERRRNRDWVTLTTAQIIEQGVKRSNGVAQCRSWEIPQHKAVEFPAKETLVNPYTLGVWLGNGGRNSGSVAQNDLEPIEHMRDLGEEINKYGGKESYSWGIKKLKRGLRSLGLLDKYSYQRSVPIDYMENTSYVRSEVLRGLLDTDGEVTRNGSIVFGSTSKALADDVIWLCRSLGGKAQMQPTVKKPFYTDDNGQRVDGRDCWRATLCFPKGFQAFYVKRKQERIPADIQDRYLTRWIDSMEPVGRAESSCISVAHPSHCYLANDFIVTHNTTELAMIFWWLMATRPGAHGTVTAGSWKQLETKTWPAISRWHGMMLTPLREWFHVGADKVFAKCNPKNWFAAMQSCAEEDAENFQGQHAHDSTSFYIFDEASKIADKIWEVAEGGLSTGESHLYAFGNPVKRSGEFFQACFGTRRNMWQVEVIDSRESAFTNKAHIEEQLKEFGEDSDRFRVRVRGLPPSAGELQYIDSNRVYEAQRREPTHMPDDALVVGVDVARGGMDDCRIVFRIGRNANCYPSIRISGQDAADSMQFAGKLAQILSETYIDPIHGHQRKVDMCFIDGGGVGGPVCDRLVQSGWGKTVTEVQFGAASPDRHYYLVRSYIWGKMRDWLSTGSIPNDRELEIDLTGPEFHHNRKDELCLEPKDSMRGRGLDSPDYGDALALTFTYPVKIKNDSYRPRSPYGKKNSWLHTGLESTGNKDRSFMG